VQHFNFSFPRASGHRYTQVFMYFDLLKNFKIVVESKSKDLDSSRLVYKDDRATAWERDITLSLLLMVQNLSDAYRHCHCLIF